MMRYLYRGVHCYSQWHRKLIAIFSPLALDPATLSSAATLDMDNVHV